MALNIKDPVTEQLASELAQLTGETKTAAVRAALAERRERLLAARAGAVDERRERILRLLQDEIWALAPPEALDRPPLTRAEREEILGIGPEGW